MTQRQTNFIKDNLINFSTLVIVIGFIVSQAKWQERVDNYTKKFESHLIEYVKHEKNETLHMPFEEKIEMFVPRVEIDVRLTNIELLLQEVRDELKD